MDNVPWTQLSVSAGFVLLYIGFKVKATFTKRKVLAILRAGAKVIDVRSPSEFASGHYPAAINIPHDKIGSKIKSIGPRNDPVVVYCASGMRSSIAAQTLRSNGFSNVLNAGKLSAMPATGYQ